MHVIGAGVMGGDIAAWCALRGFTSRCRIARSSTSSRRCKRAAGAVRQAPAGPGQKNAAARARLRADVAGDGVAAADVVIEAIFENLEAKQALYARLEPRMKPAALLATNTSSLMLEPLAAKLARPERLVGLHFFNPVAQMPLVEVVHAQRTEPAAVQAATALRAPPRQAAGALPQRARASWSTGC